MPMPSSSARGAGMHPAIFVTTGDKAPYGADYDAIPPLQGPHAAYSTYHQPQRCPAPPLF